MSAMSLGNLAAARDKEPSGKEVRSANETLVAIVPTEVLATYTALVAIVISTVTAGDYAAFRWGAYAAFVVLAAAAPISSFRTEMNRTVTEGGRKLPLAECAAAAAAAAAWGLVMPGSPLDLLLQGQAMTLASAAIVLGAGTLLTIASTFLKRANSEQTNAGGSGHGVVPAEQVTPAGADGGQSDTADLLGYRKLAGR